LFFPPVFLVKLQAPASSPSLKALSTSCYLLKLRFPVSASCLQLAACGWSFTFYLLDHEFFLKKRFFKIP